jgi:hypothetical protein
MEKISASWIFGVFDGLNRDSRHRPIEGMIAVAHNDRQWNGEGSDSGRGRGERGRAETTKASGDQDADEAHQRRDQRRQ